MQPRPIIKKKSDSKIDWSKKVNPLLPFKKPNQVAQPVLSGSLEEIFNQTLQNIKNSPNIQELAQQLKQLQDLQVLKFQACQILVIGLVQLLDKMEDNISLKIISFLLFYFTSKQIKYITNDQALFEKILLHTLQISEEHKNDIYFIKEEILIKLINILQQFKETFPNYSKNNYECYIRLFQTFKNLACNETLRGIMLKTNNIQIFRHFLIFFSKENSQEALKLQNQIVSQLRNLIITKTCLQIYKNNQIIPTLCDLISNKEQNKELSLNICRILTKLSLDEQCSRQIYTHPCLPVLLSFFKVYKQNVNVLMRVAFIFANITTFISEIRQIIFKQEYFDDIYICFQFYFDQTQLSSDKKQLDQFNVSRTGFDFNQLQKENDSDVLMMIIRMFANIFTDSTIGNKFVLENQIQYKDLLKKLSFLLKKQKNEMIQCCLSCLANILFYDKKNNQTFAKEISQLKENIIYLLPDYVMQIENEEVCCESLRVLSNLSKENCYIQLMVKTKILDAIKIFLESSSKEIVYYCVGIMINISQISVQLIQEQDFINIQQITKDCTENESDIRQICNIFIQNLIQRKLFLDISQQKQNEQNQMSMSQVVKENASFDFACKVPNCGRKFASKELLNTHVLKRHKM